VSNNKYMYGSNVYERWLDGQEDVEEKIYVYIDTREHIRISRNGSMIATPYH
jgi:hypothetical protein